MKKSIPFTNLLLSGILMCLVVVIYQNHHTMQGLINAKYNEKTPGVVTVSDVRTPSPHLGYALIPVNPDGSINVLVKGVDDVIDVNIEEIDTYDKLNVHIKSTDNYALKDAGPVEVDMK